MRWWTQAALLTRAQRPPTELISKTGPLETEIFHFHETWTLWWTREGVYQLEGSRTYESPKDELREEDFQAVLSPKFELQKVVLRSHLRFVKDSGPY